MLTCGTCRRSKSSLSRFTSKDVPSPSSESKKRSLEQDDSTRPLKKTKPSEPPPSDQARKPPRTEIPSSREHARSASKDGRMQGSQQATGSRAVQSSARDAHRAVSPRITVNGSRSQASASRNSLPPKPDTSGKHLVPPLLSPLRRLPFDEELETSSPKKRPVDNHGPGKPPSKAQQSEVTVKKQKSVTPDLPPLLSPTLPPAIEEALARIKTPSKADQPPSQSSDSPSSARKARPRADDVDEEFRPKSKIVTMKIKKGSYRKRLQSLLALPSKSSKERSVSVEDTPPPARKRPRPSEADPEPTSSISAKRPRTAEISASKAPYTPPKPATANSHSAPGSSQMQTPGERVAQTPSAGDAGPPGREGGSQAAKEMYKHRWETFSRIGRKLKHKRDGECQTNGTGPGAGGGGQSKRADIDTNRRAVLTIEMILAYMICFRSGDQKSELSGTPMNMQAWLTLEPHLRELKGMARHSLPLQALASQLHGTVINEIVRAYGSLGMPNGEVPKIDKEVSKGVFHALRSNSRIWTEANELRSRVSEKSLKTPNMGPWTSAHKAATDSLAVLARFAEREHVNWRAEVVVPSEVV